jgi:hypothetical protein
MKGLVNKSLRDAFDLLACAREQSGIPFGPLAPKLSVAEVRRVEKSTGRHFPEEMLHSASTANDRRQWRRDSR